MSDQDEVTRRIREGAERLPIRVPPPTIAMANGRRRRRVSVAVTAVAALVIAVGVAFPLRALMRLGEGVPPKPIGPSPSGVIEPPDPTGTIAFLSGGQAFGPISLLDVASGTTEPLTSQSFNSLSLAWSPDGSLIATTDALGEGIGELVLVSAETGKVMRTMPIDPLLHPQDADWSPDGRVLAFTDGLGRLHTIEADGSDLQDVPTDGLATNIAYSPTGNQIALVSDKGDLKILDLGTGTTTVVFEDPPDKRVWFGPTWSPDGSLLAFSMDEEDGSSINIVNTDGSGLRQLVAPSEDATNPSWSPDGNWISFEGGDERRDLFVVSVEGATLRRLTDSGLGEFGSDWGTRRLSL